MSGYDKYSTCMPINQAEQPNLSNQPHKENEIVEEPRNSSDNKPNIAK